MKQSFINVFFVGSVREDLAVFNSKILVEFGELNQHPLISVFFLDLGEPHDFSVSANFERLKLS